MVECNTCPPTLDHQIGTLTTREAKCVNASPKGCPLKKIGTDTRFQNCIEGIEPGREMDPFYLIVFLPYI
jgi:hypothetical protein